MVSSVSIYLTTINNCQLLVSKIQQKNQKSRPICMLFFCKKSCGRQKIVVHAGSLFPRIGRCGLSCLSCFVSFFRPREYVACQPHVNPHNDFSQKKDCGLCSRQTLIRLWVHDLLFSSDLCRQRYLETSHVKHQDVVC